MELCETSRFSIITFSWKSLQTDYVTVQFGTLLNKNPKNTHSELTLVTLPSGREYKLHSSCSKAYIFSKNPDLPCDHIFFNRLAQRCHDLHNCCGMLIMSVINVIHVVHQQFFKNKVDSTVQRKNVQNDSLLFTRLLVFVSMASLY